MRFSKYHGLGNDFLVVDLRGGDPEAVQDSAAVRALCDRRFGVGGDGILAVLPPQTEGAQARMRVLNADGGEAEMCGNGIRCVVKHLYENEAALRISPLTLDTGAGPLACEVTLTGQSVVGVTVNMGRPRLMRSEIPMTGPGNERCVQVPLPAGGKDWPITCVSMGNPHAITFVKETGPALRSLAESVGPAIENHSWFPNRTNAEFARVVSETEIELVVWERGCGITLACGTGACATAVAACLTGQAKTETEITVNLLGGPLAITVAKDMETVYMRGPAEHVFNAEIDVAAVSRARA